MRIPLLVAFGAALGLASQSVADVAGCYDVALSSWRPVEQERVTFEAPPPNEGPDSLIYAVPRRVELHPSPSRWSDGEARVILVPPGALPTPHPMASWNVAGDSVRLIWSTSYAGVIADLQPAEEGWSGWARTFSDVEGVRRHEAPLALRAVDCASPPPVGVAGLDSLLRRVTLTDGMSIRLGQPLAVPSSRRLTRRSGALTIDGTASGIFAGADTVLVRLVRGTDTVSAITVKLDRDKDLQPFVDRLEVWLGPSMEGGIMMGRTWMSRITGVRVVANLSTGHRIGLSDPRLEW